jgi:hypothetical protein
LLFQQVERIKFKVRFWKLFCWCPVSMELGISSKTAYVSETWRVISYEFSVTCVAPQSDCRHF